MPDDAHARSPLDLARLFIADARKISPDLVVVDEKPTNIHQRPAALVTAEIPQSASSPQQGPPKRARYDWIFIQTGENRFALLEQVSPAGPAGPAALALKEVIQSLELHNEDSLTRKWQDRSRAGTEFLSRIDEAVLRRVLESHGTETWYRQHAVDPEGRTIELGYAGISMMETSADQLGKPNPIPNTDGDTGLLVRLRTRRLPIEGQTHILDVDFQSWLSWDRQEEFFSTVATARTDGDEKPASMSHIGVRPRPTAGNPIRTLEVMQLRADNYTRETVTLELPELEHYLSETERLILAYLLPIVGAPSGEFSLWGWQPQRQEITRRLDSWQLEDNGGWTLLTRSYPDAKVSKATIDPDGSVSKRIVATSINTEEWTRMDPASLIAHYRRRGIDADF